jgi:GTP-binding protein Era
LPIIAAWQKLHDFVAVVPVAALHGQGVEALGREVVERLPEGPKHFPDDQLTNRPLRWHAAELVRAELFEHLSQELPYSCAVVITRYGEKKAGDAVEATIFVERDSQRGMVIGKGATVIKAIGIGARKRIERFTGRACDLRLRVDVAANWTRDPARLATFGYKPPDEGGGE